MMKKNGFTLAEVLITLAIIGVVATMTLPTLMNNAGEQQYKTGLKKAINTLTEAGQMNDAIAGYDYSSCIDQDTTSIDQVAHQSLYGIFANRTSIDRKRTGNAGGTGSIMKQSGSTTATTKFSVFFRDGSVLMYDLAATNPGGTDSKVAKLAADGLPVGFPAIIDVNGPKGPNLMSNCKKATLGGSTYETFGVDENGADTGSDLLAASASLETQCSKENRVIKDRFAIQLRGTRAVPVGAAANWAFEN